MTTEVEGNPMLTDPEELDLESQQIREVYAHYGLAMFHAQALERQIALFLASGALPHRNVTTRRQFDDLLGSLFQRTLGALIGQMRRTVEVPQTLEAELTEALRRRNWLTHDYFWERAVDFMTSSGRESMIEELRAHADVFNRLDSQLTEITYIWAHENGLTHEMIQKELQQLLADK